MDLNTLLMGIPILLLAYNGLGLLLHWQKDLHVPWAQRGDSTARVQRESQGVGAKLSFNKALLEIKWLREKVELLLLRSGYLFGWTPLDVVFYQELMAAVLLFIAWQTQPDNILILILAPVFGFYLPLFYLKTKGAARQAAILRQLPGYVDLLALGMESGLDLVPSTERILEKMKPNPLKDEMTNFIQENRLGTPRKEALQHLAYRVNLSDLQSLTSVIIQSEELGTSLANVMRTFAEDMRNRRILRAEEAAGKAPVKILIPMMVFFFPIVFVIIFGPLALTLLSSYK